MKIAAPVDKKGQLEDHYGHCAFYKVYTISDDGRVLEEKIIASDQGCGCKSGVARKLALDGVKIMLAGGIGAGAVSNLNDSGIDVIRGCSGPADELVQLYLAGKIRDNGNNCQHHEHHHGHGHEHHSASAS